MVCSISMERHSRQIIHIKIDIKLRINSSFTYLLIQSFDQTSKNIFFNLKPLSNGVEQTIVYY